MGGGGGGGGEGESIGQCFCLPTHFLRQVRGYDMFVCRVVNCKSISMYL